MLALTQSVSSNHFNFQILNKISNEVRALLVGIIFPLCIFINLDFWGLNAIRAHATVFFRGFQYISIWLEHDG